LDAFIDGTDSEPFGALGDEGTGDFEGAVPITVSLDYSGDCNARSDEGAHGPVIAGNLLARHENIRPKGRHCFHCMGPGNLAMQHE
jgi:hypothetical protein